MQGLRAPAEILGQKLVREILVSKPQDVYSVSPASSVLEAVQLMDRQDIGFLVVLDAGALVGVVSERDCVRRVLVPGKDAARTSIREIMVHPVANVEPFSSFAEALKIMHERRIRHLVVTENQKTIGVISIRDLLAAAVKHHASLIAELERERWTMLNSVV